MPKNQQGHSKVQRQNQIKRLLSLTSKESALSISDIYEKLKNEGYGVNRRTIERDILEISTDYPLSETGSNPRRFFFDKEFNLNFELVFDENQLQMIVIALETMKAISPKFLQEICNGIENTLVSRMPRALAKEFEYLKSLSCVTPTILGQGADSDPIVFNTVLHCLRKGKVFECGYFSPNEKRFSDRKRLFAPLKLHFVGAPYLYVYDCENSEIKLLRISRIHNAIKTDQNVDKTRAREIKLDHVFGAFGSGEECVVNYVIKCTKPMALKFKEQRIHPSQKIKVLADGFFEITFKVHDSDEVVRLLSQYGEFIRDIKPKNVYEKVKEIWKNGLAAA